MKKNRCAICASVANLKTRSLRGSGNCSEVDQRVLCDACNTVLLELISSGVLDPAKYQNHHGLFGAAKAKVKSKLGLTGQNLFLFPHRKLTDA